MSNVIEVECTHIENELMRVRFANTQIVSDHPVEWGGTDTGPAPGDMVIMALTAASALAGRRFAASHNLDVGHIGARASMRSLQEGFPEQLRHVPLPHLTYVERFWQLLEIDGRLGEGERDALVGAMGDNTVARTIRDGMEIEERVIFHKPAPGTVHWAGQGEGNSLLKDRPSLPAGETRIAAKAGNWRVSAAALDERTCLVKATGAMFVVGDTIASQRGAIPEELLLGGLAACTTIYIARNAQFHGILPHAVSVRVRGELPDTPGQPITRVEKIAEVTGDFTEEEIAKLRHFAEFCAFGVTLGRGSAIEESLAINETDSAVTVSPSFAFLDRTAPAPDDPAYCIDGSCCVPMFEQRRS